MSNLTTSPIFAHKMWQTKSLAFLGTNKYYIGGSMERLLTFGLQDENVSITNPTTMVFKPYVNGLKHLQYCNSL
jgi:hypothetical protein